MGATDFTLEIWLRCLPGSNPAPQYPCGQDVNWIYGNIILDRDRYNQDRKFGVSLVGGRPIFGMSGNGSGDRTICASTDLRDGAWHHLAVQRRRSDGHLWIFVDGILEADADGPDGDVSYPDDGLPGDYCGGPCVDSDPFLVLAAEKHDAGSAYPSFDGWLDELRVSTTLRYGGPFVPPAAPFTPDVATAALYHLDEGAGNSVNDDSGAPGGPSPGERRYGGSPAGPEWSTDTPFGGPSGVVDEVRSGGGSARPRLTAAPNPFRSVTTIAVPHNFQGDLDVFDLLGRRVARLGRVGAGTESIAWDGRDSSGRLVPPGLYFVRSSPDGSRPAAARPEPLRIIRR